MARTNPCSLPRPKAQRDSKTFTDELQPEASWECVFEVQAGSDFDLALAEKTDKYNSDYVTGRDNKKPALLSPIDGKRVLMTYKLCASIAMLELADVTPLAEGETAWGFDQWRALAVTAPNAFEDMAQFVGSLYEQAFSAAKN